MSSVSNRSSFARRRARIALFAAVVLSAGVLAACATPPTAQVTAFNQLGGDSAAAAVAGKRFVIVPDAAQQNSLEFGSYAALVRQALVEKGLVEGGGSDADYRVMLGYGSTSASTGGVEGGPGSGLAIGGGNFGIGIGFPLGGRSSEALAYRHQLRVTLDAASASGAPDAAPAARVYEGTASVERSTESLSSAMPTLVRALFADFPGRTVR